MLLGAKPEAPVNETAKAAALAARNARLGAAGSAFLRAAFDLIGEIAGAEDAGRQAALRDELREAVDVKVVADEQGKPRFSFALPSREAVATLLRGISGLFAGPATEGARAPAPLAASRAARQNGVGGAPLEC